MPLSEYLLRLSTAQQISETPGRLLNSIQQVADMENDALFDDPGILQTLIIESRRVTGDPEFTSEAICQNFQDAALNSEEARQCIKIIMKNWLLCWNELAMLIERYKDNEIVYDGFVQGAKDIIEENILNGGWGFLINVFGFFDAQNIMLYNEQVCNVVAEGAIQLAHQFLAHQEDNHLSAFLAVMTNLGTPHLRDAVLADPAIYAVYQRNKAAYEEEKQRREAEHIEDHRRTVYDFPNQLAFIEAIIAGSPDLPSDEIKQCLVWAWRQTDNLTHPVYLYFGSDSSFGKKVVYAADEMKAESGKTHFYDLMKRAGINLSMSGFCYDSFLAGLDENPGWGIWIHPMQEPWLPQDCTAIHTVKPDLSDIAKIELPANAPRILGYSVAEKKEISQRDAPLGLEL